MSKKIIYLLSLLMALSLVFASCKKNNGITGNDFTPDEVPNVDNTENTDANTGLFKNYDDLTHTEPIRKVEVMRGNGTDYVRNPVIVAMGKGLVFIFGEKRYARAGAGNDVGIDGEGVVDIVYYVSTDSGNKWSKQEYYVNEGTGKVTTTTTDGSHGAPVVFKINESKIVIAASAGSGIGRTSKPATGGGRPASRIDYIIGSVSGTTITWGKWTTIVLEGEHSLQAKVQETKISGKTMDQFGTHSARGVVGTDNKIYLPVTMAYQGTSDNWNNTYELMGYILLTGTGADGSTITWTAGTGVAYTSNGKFTKYKEARGTSVGSDGKVQYIVVPSPSYGHTLIGTGKTDSQPTDTTVTGSEGSAGFLLTDKWFGTARYNLDSSTGNIASDSTSSAKQMAVLTHVQAQDANMNMYVLNPTDLTKAGSKSYFIVAKGKSSSIDILEDGTIITAAEEGLAGANRNYYTVFSRYSQKFIAEQNGIQ